MNLLLLFDQTDWQQDRMSLQTAGSCVCSKATIATRVTSPTLCDSIPIHRDLLGIIGPSGAGKSTSQRNIGPVVTSSGDIRIDGAEASHYNQ